MSGAPPLRVAVLSDTTGQTDDPTWLERYVPNEARSRYVFVPVRRDEPTRSSHERGKVAGLSDWRRDAAYVRKALRGKPDVVVTLFPQPALIASALASIGRTKAKVVCWAFNLGATSNPAKGRAAGAFLRGADRLIVHSSDEVRRYAAWLGLPEASIQFVPLQRGVVRVPTEEALPPYAVAMGSAGRDYASLIEAARRFEGRVIIVARQALLDELDAPPNVEHRSGLSMQECLELTAGARLTVVPVSNLETASGQITFITSMAQRVPVVATDCPGTRDYLDHEATALIVPPRDAAALRIAMTRLWDDEALRRRIADDAYAAWQSRFSDEAAARAFVRVLDKVTGQGTGEEASLEDAPNRAADSTRPPFGAA